MLPAPPNTTTPVCGPHATDSVAVMSTLAERLGHRADTRLVIISCDDLGSCHAANEGVLSSLHHGVATCASLMVPAPWARDVYGRLLAYAYVAETGAFVNLEIMQGGYAHTLTIPPNVAHSTEFVKAARTAEHDNVGLWAACNG